MLVLLLFFSTLLLVLWTFLLLSVNILDWQASAYNKIVMNQKSIEKYRQKETTNAKKMERWDGIAYSIVSLFCSDDYSKKIAKLDTTNDQIKKGNFKSISIIPTCGHVMLRHFSNIRTTNFYRGMMSNFAELYGRKHAKYLCDHMIASMVSFSLLGVGSVLCLGVIKLAGGDLQTGGMILGFGISLVMVLTYALVNEVTSNVRIRREGVQRQFPNVVSKLALLVTSGMIMDKAWKQTAFSQDDTLYLEMRKTALELENLVPPQEAFGGFINRCQTKETSKLATSILQNLAKGNSEIGVALQTMAAEAWQERRHLAKRDSEAANAKMMLPTVLLFSTILMLILVPIASNFSTF